MCCVLLLFIWFPVVFFALLLCHFFLTCSCLMCSSQTSFCYAAVKANDFFTVFLPSESCLLALSRLAWSLGIWRWGSMRRLSLALCNLWVTWLNVLYRVHAPSEGGHSLSCLWVLGLSPSWPWGRGASTSAGDSLLGWSRLSFPFSLPSVTTVERKGAWECWKVVVHTGKFIWSFWQASACPFPSFPSSKGSYRVYLSLCIYHQFYFSSLLRIFSASSFFHSPSPLWLDQSSQGKDDRECPDSCSYNPTESQKPPRPRAMLSLTGWHSLSKKSGCSLC